MTIKRKDSKFTVVSKKGKNLGPNGTKKAAAKRLRQVEHFKKKGR